MDQFKFEIPGINLQGGISSDLVSLACRYLWSAGISYVRWYLMSDGISCALEKRKRMS